MMATEAWSFLAGSRHARVHRATHKVTIIQGFDGGSGFAIVVHGHKSETTGSSRFTIFDNFSGCHITIGGKSIEQVLVFGRPRQISYIYFHFIGVCAIFQKQNR